MTEKEKIIKELIIKLEENKREVILNDKEIPGWFDAGHNQGIDQSILVLKDEIKNEIRYPHLGETWEEISSSEQLKIRLDNIERVTKEIWEYKFIKS